MATIVSDKDKYIKKHHATIHCSTQLSLLQRKLANCLLFKAYHELKTQTFHDISIQEIMSLLGIKTNDYGKLKENIRSLMSTIIEWDILNNHTNYSRGRINNQTEKNNLDSRWEACSLLASVQIKGSLIRYEYSQTLKDRFFQPSQYTKVKLIIQNKFKSLYSFILYENCLRYINVGSTCWMNISIFKKLMGLNHSQYSIFRDLNRRIIQPAIKEINNISDIKIDVNLKKINRKPVEIKFFVKRNDVYLGISAENKPDIESDGKIEFELKKFGVSQRCIASWVKKYPSSKILEKIEIIRNSSNNIRNVAGFLKSALECDYKLPISKNMDHIDSSSAETEQYLNSKKKQELYREFVDNQFFQWISKLPESEKNILRGDLKNYSDGDGRLIPPIKKAKEYIDIDPNFENVRLFTALKIFVFEELKKENGKNYLKNLNIPSFEEFDKIREKGK